MKLIFFSVLMIFLPITMYYVGEAASLGLFHAYGLTLVWMKLSKRAAVVHLYILRLVLDCTLIISQLTSGHQ